ncbi:MAG: hypothetical protein AVDCRST_MAG74-2338 [uncultured Pyrinomonadaceae bacterium]|uniref:Uncharacterized protein n=1 Tax=uncultured Pyrinomonadaceae bacterium TaxID=2283094 RepID=A0A6J4PCE3_9BACT|nr:MAG: hypothetical protein AVDCRST_MAG74-2338 [uncultured Pyrinomonadaceae bacterium]
MSPTVPIGQISLIAFDRFRRAVEICSGIDDRKTLYYLIGALYFLLAVGPKVNEMNFRDIETPTTIFIFLYIFIGMFPHHLKSLDFRGMVKPAKEEEKELANNKTAR